MGFNSLSATISGDGIKYQGSLFGANSPEIDQSLSNTSIDANLKIHVKGVYIQEVISAQGNNKFYLPVSAIGNKFVLFIRKKAYYPNIDFTCDGNRVTWLNGTITILPGDEVTYFGPVNKYTSNAITFEPIDMTDTGAVFTLEDGDFSDKPTITLNQEDENDYPYSKNSIFFFVGHKLYSPVTTPDAQIDYDEPSKKIIWNLQETVPLSTESQVFAFYYNLQETDPFLLGSALTRIPLIAGDDNDGNYSLAVRPKLNLLNSPNLFHNGLRYTKGIGITGNTAKDYKVNFPTLELSEDGRLKSIIELADNIDFSYFSDTSIVSVASMVNQNLSAGTIAEDSPDENIYKTAMLPIATTVEQKKAFLFMNGLLATKLSYDNYANITTSFSGILPEYTLQSLEFIKWDSTARSDLFDDVPPAIPISGDKFVFKAMVDAVSIDATKVSYFQRTSVSGASIVLADEISQNKVIWWYNGKANFTQAPLSHFTVESDKKTLLYASLGITAPPAGLIEEMTILSFIDEAYASLWSFDGYIHDDVDTTPGVTEITLTNTITDKNVSFLFKNGDIIANDKFTLGGTNKKIILTEDILTDGDELMFVHI